MSSIAIDGPAARGRTGGAGGANLGLALRFALREMRGGLRGFYVFLACVMLGTATIAGVNSLAKGLSDGIAAEGQALLGGDISFSLIHRQASEDERAMLAGLGRLSTMASLRAMARTGAGKQTLVELKGVDGAYPLYGALKLRGGRELGEIFAAATPDGPVPAAVDPSLLTVADLSVGDTFSLGRLTMEVAAVIDSEPDKLSGGLGLGPRVMLPVEALERSGLVDEGSLVRWHYRVAGEAGMLSADEIKRTVAAANEAFPSAGWRVETRGDAAPRLRESIGRFAQFLTLVGLTSLAVGGVGVANAVRAYLDRKRLTIATLRSLGAPAGWVTQLYLVQILILTAIGIAAGLVLGAAAPPIAAAALAGVLPTSALVAVFPGALALAALYGLLTALTFAVWPLGLAYGVRPTALFRDDDGAPAARRTRFAVATGVLALLLAAVAVLGAYDQLLAAIYVVAAAAIFALLRGVAVGITALARRAPRSRSTPVRMAVANIHRRGALTPTVTLSLGLSLTLLVTLALVDGNLRNTLTSQLPERAPSFFFVDIQDFERDGFLALLDEAAPDSTVRAQPMLRGRIVAINDTPSSEWPDTEASWVLRGDRGITYADAPPENSEIVAGRWWSPDTAENEVSFAAELAGELGVGLGDVVRVNVLGREVSATITNLRTVEWESLSINFVMMFSPNVFAGAPHAHLATLTFADGGDEARELALLSRLTDAYPTVTAVRVKDALEAVNSVVGDLVLAVRAAASVTLIASMLVLAGTLAASHRSRIYDAVILKTLGARRRTLMLAFGIEYALLGLAAGVFGIVAGTVAAWFITEGLMELDFVFLPQAALVAALVAIAVTVGLGLVGTWRALGEKPAAVLRNL